MQKRSYAADRIPFIPDVPSYRNSWVEWWTLCQPSWRQNKGWPLPRDNASRTDWLKVIARGQNGLFLVVLSTAWWAYSIVSERDWVEFDEVVDDIQWVIDNVLGSLKALPPPVLPVPPKAPQKPKSSQGGVARADGKRKTRLPPRYLGE